MVIQLFLLLLAIPAGFFIAWFTRDELVQGRKYFKIIIIASILGALYFFLTTHKEIAFSSLFILVISLISYHKSFDKKWTTKKLK